MLKCIIVNELTQATQLLKNYITKIPFLEFIGSYNDPKAALVSLKKKPADLVILHIRRQEQTAPPFIQVFQMNAMVILTSANKELALAGFENDVVDFLVKPVLFERFYRAAEKVYKRKYPQEHTKPNLEKSTANGGFVFIKDSTRLVRVDLDDIFYIMGLKNYVCIQTKSHRIISLLSMKQIEELLPSHRFIRVHRSYFVALDKIVSVEKQQIHLRDKVIPIGNVYLPSFIKKLTKTGNQ
jgi:DNA-binding LytR/AlgR family response regulator